MTELITLGAYFGVILGTIGVGYIVEWGFGFRGARDTGWLWRTPVGPVEDKHRETAIDYLRVQGHTAASAQAKYDEWVSRQ